MNRFQKLLLLGFFLCAFGAFAAQLDFRTTAEMNANPDNQPTMYSASINGVTISRVGNLVCDDGDFRAGPAGITLLPETNYDCVIVLNVGEDFCAVTSDMSVDASCLDIYIDGEDRSPYIPTWSNNTFFETRRKIYSFAVSLRLNTNTTPITTWEIKSQSGFKGNSDQKTGWYTLPADGMSQAISSGTGTNVTFTLVSGPSDCTLSNTSYGTVFTAGTNLGTAHVVAQTSDTNICLMKDFHFDLVQCDGSCSSGTCDDSYQNNSVDVRLSLGPSRVEPSRAFLQIKSVTPSSTLGSPQSLQCNFLRPEFEIINDANGWLRQVRAQDRVADITTNSSTSYSIRFYNLTNLILPRTNAVYSFTNSPFKTVTVQLVGGDTNHFQVSSDLDPAPADYYWQTNAWELITGGGIRHDVRSVTTNGTLRTEVRTIKNASGTVEYQSSETWQTSSFGDRLLTNIVGTGAAARTERRTYDSAGRLSEADHGDGSWEIFASDTRDRQVGRYSSFQNASPTTNSALCRYTLSSYDTNNVSGSGDDGTWEPYTPRMTVNYVLGQEVSRSYSVIRTNQRVEIQCVTAGAAWNASDNLVTTNIIRTDAVFFGKPSKIFRPDGTEQIFAYTYQGTPGTLFPVFNKVIVSTGAPNSTGSSVTNGIREETWSDDSQRMVARMSTDIASGTVINFETYSYDERGHLINTVFQDGTAVQQSYDCCNLQSRAERDGTVTSFTYDNLKRLLTTTVNGVTVSNVYNSNNEIVSTVRYGTDGSKITKDVSLFDNSGELIVSTNALGNPTLFTNYFDGSGQLVRVTTHADGGTDIATYFKDGSLQSRTGTAVFPVRYDYGVEQDAGVYRGYVKEIKLDTNGSDTSEWTKTYTDMAGRPYKTVYSTASGTNFSISYFNAKGQVANQIDPDGISTLSQYNTKGELLYTAIDLQGDGQLHQSGSNRITQVVSDVITNAVLGTWVQRTRTFVWPTNSVDASNLISTVEIATNALTTWNTLWNKGVGVTNRTDVLYIPTSGLRIQTDTAPDGSYAITTNQYGRLSSITRFDSSGLQIAKTTYGYDAHGRQNTATDARAGTTTFYFNNSDQVSGNVTPSPDGVQSGQSTTNYFDVMGRVWKTTLPDNTSVTNEFFLTGLRKKTYGSRQYPVEYSYDAQGRVKTMTTWQNFAATNGSAVTTWNYDAYRGYLLSKRDANSQGETYTRTAAGKLLTRTLARGITRTNSYNTAGDLRTVTYSDTATPSLAYFYDRRGRATNVLQTLSGQFTNSTVLTFDDAGDLLSEAGSSGILNGLSLTNGFDTKLRRVAVALSSQASTVTQFGYDNASRLLSVTNGLVTASYSYLTNSSLWGTLTLKQNGNTRMTTSRQFDNLNRLTSITSFNSQSTNLGSFAYQYSASNQRTNVVLNDNSHWVYLYDSLGQVISGKRYWADGTPVAGQQFEYTFDDIGNRKTAKMGGKADGSALRTATYGANLLNQYTNRTIPSAIDVIGDANSNATVTINFLSPYRHGDYFWKELPVANGSAPVYQGVTNIGVLRNGTNADIIATNSGNALVSKTPEVFFHDLDGNLLSDGLWTNTWDAENRLIQAQSLSTVPDAGKFKLSFVYDYQGRRIQKVVSAWNGSTYVAQSTNKFVYDGWNVVAELDRTNGLLRSYAWGLDLSGSMQGAGGVGGLLALNTATNGTHFTSFDGNGNVSAMVDASNNTISAQFEYGPFGESIGAFGAVGNSNPIRFSTKYCDTETGWSYYGYRYYNPGAGRWLSRDPAGEQGGIHLYGFAKQAPPGAIDPLGKDAIGTVQAKLSSTITHFAGSKAAQTTGFPDAVAMLAQRVLPRIRATYTNIPSGHAAEYDRDTDTMLLQNEEVGESTIVHEMVHAYNDVIAGESFLNFRRDEGMGYMMQSFYGVNDRLMGMEDIFQRDCSKRIVKDYWQGFWRDYGTIPSSNWGEGATGFGAFDLNMYDLRNVTRTFSVHLTCPEIAEIYNKILKEKGCCCRVKCSGADTDSEISPGKFVQGMFQ